MAMGIYKPGQGYWTRTLTVIGAVVCFGAAALWAWSELAAFPVPTPTWQLTLGDHEQPVEVGEQVALRRLGENGSPVVIGHATVQEAPGGAIIVGDVVIDNPDENALIDAESIAFGEPVLSARIVGTRGFALFEVLYIQAGAAGVILLIGVLVIYYYVGANKKSADFLIATDNEMKKVNWSTRKDVIGSTWVVIAATFLLAAGLFGVDLIFSQFFRWVGVLTN